MIKCKIGDYKYKHYTHKRNRHGKTQPSSMSWSTQRIVSNFLAVVTSPLATISLVALVRLGPVELISWLDGCEFDQVHLILAGLVCAVAATLYRLYLVEYPVYLVEYSCLQSSLNHPLYRIPMASFI